MSARRQSSGKSTHFAIVAVIISAISCYYSFCAYNHTTRGYAAERREECLQIGRNLLTAYDSSASDFDTFVDGFRNLYFQMQILQIEMSNYTAEATGTGRQSLQSDLAEAAKTITFGRDTLTSITADRNAFETNKTHLTKFLDTLDSDEALNNTDPAFWLRERRLLTIAQQDLDKSMREVARGRENCEKLKKDFLSDKTKLETLIRIHNLVFFWRDRPSPPTLNQITNPPTAHR